MVNGMLGGTFARVRFVVVSNSLTHRIERSISANDV